MECWVSSAGRSQGFGHCPALRGAGILPGGFHGQLPLSSSVRGCGYIRWEHLSARYVAGKCLVSIAGSQLKSVWLHFLSSARFCQRHPAVGNVDLYHRWGKRCSLEQSGIFLYSVCNVTSASGRKRCLVCALHVWINAATSFQRWVVKGEKGICIKSCFCSGFCFPGIWSWTVDASAILLECVSKR